MSNDMPHSEPCHPISDAAGAGQTTPLPSEGIDALSNRICELEAELRSLRNELNNACERPYRKRLPTTRRSLTHKFAIGQHEGYITVGLYEDGRPGELFLTMAKEGSTIGGLMDTVGILTSLALQHGVSVETLARKFEHASFEPSGWTRNPEIRRAASTVDYVFRWLGMEFCVAYRQEKLAIREHIPLSASHFESDVDAKEAMDSGRAGADLLAEEWGRP